MYSVSMYSSISRITQQIAKHGLKNEDLEVDDSKDPEYKPKKSSGGAPKKNFEDLSRNRKVKRLKPFIESALQTVKDNPGLTVKKAAAYLAEIDANTNGNADDARMFKAIRGGENPFKHKRMDVKKAVALQVFIVANFRYSASNINSLLFSIHSVKISLFSYQ